jgi:hypothetical protein
MSELHIRAILSGVFFGLWPLFMNRSGLTGNISSAVFALGSLIVVSPFAFYKLCSATTANVAWVMVAGACVSGGLGLLAFNEMLSKATPKTVGPLIVLMVVVQITVPALYKTIQDGGLTVSKSIGFAAAILAAFLLI